ncbi:MAG TPA: alkaline shock response membrane anchor protein AmaP [Atribacteraceae bacterium]|nr:alkaline shock response membrane anchor protein AmaP [Atribacteraceae bacterium]
MIFWGKLFALILALLVLIVAGFFSVVVLRFISALAIQRWIVSCVLFFTRHWLYQAFGLLIAAALVFVGLILLRFLLHRPDRSVLYHTPQGDIKISYNSIKALARDVLKNNPDILTLEPEVEKTGNSAWLNLRMTVKSSVSVTDFSPMVQSKVREAIERHTGITLKDVKLFIDLRSEENPIHEGA